MGPYMGAHIWALSGLIGVARVGGGHGTRPGAGSIHNIFGSGFIDEFLAADKYYLTLTVGHAEHS